MLGKRLLSFVATMSMYLESVDRTNEALVNAADLVTLMLTP